VGHPRTCKAIAAAYDIYCNCLKSGPAGGPGDFTLSSTTNGNARGNNRSVTETDTGGFLMADFNTRLGGSGCAATAACATCRPAVGHRLPGHRRRHRGDRGADATATCCRRSTWPPTWPRTWCCALAAAKVMSRPQLGFLNPGGTISTTGTLSSVTPATRCSSPSAPRPSTPAWSGTTAATRFVGLGLFQKNISTYIQSLRQNMPFKETGLPLSLLPSNFTGDEVFQVTYPVNTDGGKLQGFEINVQQPFSFLPGAGKNLGVLLNYTQVKSKIAYLVSPTSGATITDDLLNLSPKAWNATLYYDDGKFSARVSGSSRSAFLTRVPGQNNNDVEGKNSSFNVDLSVSYKLNDQIEFTLEGREPDQRGQRPVHQPRPQQLGGLPRHRPRVPARNARYKF
jgi:iron complex outermembrane receptor protein